MRAREVLGKRIVRVVHRRLGCNDFGWKTPCVRIWLDDGSSIVCDSIPTDDVPEAGMRYVKPYRAATGAA